MISHLQTLGRWGDTNISNSPNQKGNVVNERYQYTPFGEIDPIAQSKAYLNPVEVKTLGSVVYGLPETPITQQKREI